MSCNIMKFLSVDAMQSVVLVAEKTYCLQVVVWARLCRLSADSTGRRARRRVFRCCPRWTRGRAGGGGSETTSLGFFVTTLSSEETGRVFYETN